MGAFWLETRPINVQDEKKRRKKMSQDTFKPFRLLPLTHFSVIFKNNKAVIWCPKSILFPGKHFQISKTNLNQ